MRPSDWYYLVTSNWMVTALIAAFGLVGLIQFIISKYEQSKLLRVWLFIMCFQEIILQITRLLLYFFSRGQKTFITITPLDLLIGTLITAISIYSLFILQRSYKPKFETYEMFDTVHHEFTPSSKWIRLANRVIDLLFIFYIAFYFFSWARFAFEFMRGFDFVILLLEVVLLWLYYFIMEVVFNTTLGKIITNTTIVNEIGQKPTIGQIFGRTFFRFIPFDAVSFLIKDNGWHDSVSNTYVTAGYYDIEDGKKIDNVSSLN